MSTLVIGPVEGGPAAPRLIGGRHKASGKIVFPMPTGAEAEAFEPTPLKTEGTLWSFTVQRFAPKPPFIGERDQQAFKPYAVGYVELPGELIVESRLAIEDFSALRLGLPMRLTLAPFAKTETGEIVHTFAFAPA